MNISAPQRILDAGGNIKKPSHGCATVELIKNKNDIFIFICLTSAPTIQLVLRKKLKGISKSSEMLYKTKYHPYICLKLIYLPEHEVMV